MYFSSVSITDHPPYSEIYFLLTWVGLSPISHRWSRSLFHFKFVLATHGFSYFSVPTEDLHDRTVFCVTLKTSPQ